MEVIRIEELSLGVDDDEKILKSKVARILRISEVEILSYEIVKKAIDSRRKNNILFVYSLDVVVEDIKKIKRWEKRYRVRRHKPFIYKEKKVEGKIDGKIVVVGSGPCGLFAALLLAKAGLSPLLIEQGMDVDSRISEVSKFFDQRKLNLKTNIQFGEGGAGTFSDGKLYTLINDPRSKYVFSELIKVGAPDEIAWNASPHVGTDNLRRIIKRLRKKIISFGGKVRFETCLTDVNIKNERIKSIVLNNEEIVEVDSLILAIGHSARNTYEMLLAKNLKMSSKPFSMGLRIEHSAEMINKSQYGDFYNNPKLGAARYKLVQHFNNKRSVYSFCMCPGGYVVGATSEESAVVTNGMSEYSQDGQNSNSALLVPILVSDFGSDHPLAGIEFQRKWERRAYELGGGGYSAPVQLVGDFLEKRRSTVIKTINPTYSLGVNPASLDFCLPDYVSESLRAAIPFFGKKIKGFDDPDAIFTGVETRSSSVVRIERDRESLESNISGVFPAGEGAGYAGGIVSSAIDGMKVAEVVIEKYS